MHTLSGVLSAYGYTANTWIHIVTQGTANGMKTWVNGNLVTSTNHGGGGNNTSSGGQVFGSLFVGSEYRNTGPGLHGHMKYIRMRIY